MKERTPRSAAAALSAVLAAPAFAAAPLTADVTASSAPAKASPFVFDLGYHKASGPAGRGSVGAAGGLSEGKPLEMTLWGGGGAVIGSVAGPLGAMVGAAAGAAAGLLYSVFVVPRNGPAKAAAARTAAVP